MSEILVIDNYDSFVYTIVGYLQQLGASCRVTRNDTLEAAGLERTVAGFDGVLLSPGPGTPEESGVCPRIIEICAAQSRPLLGVCLGHQALGMVFGATVSRAPELLHGKTSPIRHDGSGVLAGLSDPFTATRYHSLAIEPSTVPEELVVNGWTESGLVMAVRHRQLPLHGVQFHPESVLTRGGHRMLANWLADCGDTEALRASEGLSPLVGAAVSASDAR